MLFVFGFSCANPVEKDSSDNSSETLFPDLNLEKGIEVVTWNIEEVSKIRTKNNRLCCQYY